MLTSLVDVDRHSRSRAYHESSLVVSAGVGGVHEARLFAERAADGARQLFIVSLRHRRSAETVYRYIDK